MRETPLGRAAAEYLAWLESHGYAKTTVVNRAHHLHDLVEFLDGRDITEPSAVTFAALEFYQRHLFLHRKADGGPLSFRTQAQRVIPVKGFFSWMVSHGYVPIDPAAAMVLPKAEHRLPEATLSADEAESVLAGPDITTPLGLRDRAILEVLYSTAIRRAELIGLKVWDVDHGRGTVFVRQGKGARDRHVPTGPRALSWVARCGDLVRPRLPRADTDTLFLANTGEVLCADWLTRTVRSYPTAGAPAKHGSCQLFRHTAATLMLDGGADPLCCRDARPRQVGDECPLHPRLDREAPRRAPGDAPCRAVTPGSRTGSQYALGHDRAARARSRRGRCATGI